MMGLDLEPIKAREAAASKGPWYSDDACDSAFDEHGQCINEAMSISSCVQDDDGGFIAECVDKGANRVFIAHAREDIPALIAEVESMRETIRVMAKALG